MMRLFFWALLPVSLASCMSFNPMFASKTITTTAGTSCKSKVPAIMEHYAQTKIVQVNWTGGCKNGELEGQGILTGLDQNNRTVFTLKGTARQNDYFILLFDKYELDFLSLGKFVKYDQSKYSSPLMFQKSGDISMSDSILSLGQKKYFLGSISGDYKNKTISHDIYLNRDYKIFDEQDQSLLSVWKPSGLNNKYPVTRQLGNPLTGEKIPAGTLIQSGKLIACYVDSRKYTNEAECKKQLEIISTNYKAELAAAQQRYDEAMAQAKQARQEQWQQLGQVLGAAATVYTAQQTQKANTARYSKPTPTPTYTPSQTSVYTPPAPTTQTNTPSYNPTPTINYPNSSTKNKVNSSEYEVHNCISINNNHLQNNCDFPVWVSQCVYNPSYDKKVQLNAFEMGSSFDCEKNIGLDSIAARSKDPARLTGQKLVWFACKKPATPKNIIFDSSRQLLTGYCQ